MWANGSVQINSLMPVNNRVITDLLIAQHFKRIDLEFRFTVLL